MGRVLVKVMGGDKGAHGLRNEIADGFAARNSLADFRGGDVDPPGEGAERAGRPGSGIATPENDELDETAQVLAAAPGVQFPQVVGTDQIVDPGLGMGGADALHGIDGEAGAGAGQLGIVQGEAGFIGEGGGEHLAAQGGGGGRSGELVGGEAGWNEDDAVELELLESIPRQDEVPMVHRVESSSVKGETHGIFEFRFCREKKWVCFDEPLRCAGYMERSSLGQLLLTGVPGPELDAATAAQFRRLQPGGYILFGRNIQSANQLRKLIDDLRDLSVVEPIITIDQEGGRVSRLKLVGNEPPNANNLRDKNDLGLIARHGTITARLLRIFGFNLDLCPVLDISFDDEADNSLRGRCYGNDVAQVIRNAGAFNDALRAGGILSCGKHFPGYSRAPLDAHHELPEIPLSREELDTHELAVFRHFADKVDSMMIGHGFYPALESSGTPSSLSRRVITDLLRGEHGFRGLVMTDDLDMGAILNHYGLEETIRLAITAGNDLAMICHRVAVVEEAHGYLERLPAVELDRALENVANFKTKQAPPDAWSEAEFARRDAEVWDLRVAVLGAEAAAQRSPEDGKRSPVEIY